MVLFDKPNTDRARTFLKIQDGCDGFCSYCQIPYARGVPRSVPIAEVLEKTQISKFQKIQELICLCVFP